MCDKLCFDCLLLRYYLPVGRGNDKKYKYVVAPSGTLDDIDVDIVIKARAILGVVLKIDVVAHGRAPLPSPGHELDVLAPGPAIPPNHGARSPGWTGRA